MKQYLNVSTTEEHRDDSPVRSPRSALLSGKIQNGSSVVYPSSAGFDFHVKQ